MFQRPLNPFRVVLDRFETINQRRSDLSADLKSNSRGLATPQKASTNLTRSSKFWPCLNLKQFFRGTSGAQHGPEDPRSGVAGLVAQANNTPSWGHMLRPPTPKTEAIPTTPCSTCRGHPDDAAQHMHAKFAERVVERVGTQMKPTTPNNPEPTPNPKHFLPATPKPPVMGPCKAPQQKRR